MEQARNGDAELRAEVARWLRQGASPSGRVAAHRRRGSGQEAAGRAGAESLAAVAAAGRKPSQQPAPVQVIALTAGEAAERTSPRPTGGHTGTTAPDSDNHDAINAERDAILAAAHREAEAVKTRMGTRVVKMLMDAEQERREILADARQQAATIVAGAEAEVERLTRDAHHGKLARRH